MTLIPKLENRLIYGGDYNPEQWPEEVWLEDVQLMRQAGVNLVSLAIFSWARIQRSEEDFDFAWLDRVMDLLYENGVFVCLATGTASPPAWLTRKYPSILPQTAEGVTLYPGSRQQYSPSSPEYHKAAKILVEKLAKRYKDHPALAAWHVNNEYGCHLPECHNEASTNAFRAWLKNRYGSLDALNEAWGTAFWSQIYYEWEEIYTPRKAPYHNNPSQQLDYRRFMSDAYRGCYRLEKAVLNQITPGIPVTTNFMGFSKCVDQFSWADDLDFAAVDSYPDPIDESAGRQMHAMWADITRSVKGRVPFVLMEQATSAVNWRPVNRPKRPGWMRILSLQTLARGGDGIMFFQWRASRAGAEKFHSGLVQHVDVQKSRVFREVVQLGDELKKLQPVAGSHPKAKVAVMVDWNCWWALELDSRPAAMDYVSIITDYHRWLYQKNISVDFVHPEQDISQYQWVVAPALYLLGKAAAENIESYVAGGGTLLMSWFSGIVDENDQVQCGGYPAFLKKVLGLWVEEWCPYPEGQGNRIRISGSESSFASHEWCDILHPESAEVLAVFEKDYFAGNAALTLNAFGKGKAYYQATRLDAEGLDYVMRQIASAAGVQAVIDAPAEVEVVMRESGKTQFLFLLNHSDKRVTVSLNQISGLDLLRGTNVSGKLILDALDAAIIQIQ